MGIRAIGTAVIKLLGLYYAASAALGICSSLAFLLIPQPGGAIQGVQYAFGASLGGWIGGAFVAAFFMLRGDDIANALLPDRSLAIANFPAGDLLWIGICLLGVGIAASAVSALARAVATALWHLGANRQAGFADAMRRLYPSPVDAALSLAVGLLLVWSARPLSSLIETRHRRRTET